MTSSALTEEQLLATSLTGVPPSSQAASFAASKSAGNAAFASGDYADALSHYAAASSFDPSSPVPHTNSALVLLRLGRPFDAERAAGTALALIAAHDRDVALGVKTLLRRSAARRELRRFGGAEDDLKEVLVMEPGHAEAVARLREMRAAGEIGQERVGIVEVERELKVGGGHMVARDVGVTVEGGGEVVRDDCDVIEGVKALAVAREAEAVPRGTADFDRAWRTLKGDDGSRGRYLVLRVGRERLGTAIGQTLTAELVEEMCVVMREAVGKERGLAQGAAAVLDGITELPRFELTVMFFGNGEKEAVRRLADALREAKVDDRLLNAVMPKYSV